MNVPYGLPRNSVYGSFSMNPYTAMGGNMGEAADNPTTQSMPSSMPALSVIGIIIVLVLIRILYEVAE